LQHLRARRDTLLEAWRQLVDADPQLTTATTLSKSQFIDHIPEMLDTFERRLTAQNDPQKREALEEQKDGAAAQGLQRWQQGYNQRETARDWGHLQLCLLAELDNFESSLDGTARAALPIAQALEEATRESQRLEAEPASFAGQADTCALGGEALHSPVHAGHGEGTGLTIVKRLYKLLEASLELESRHEGTICPVTLLRQYS